MDDEPMWAADRVVVLAPGSAITIPEIANEMLQNCHTHNLSKGNIIKILYHGLSKITQEVLNVTAGGIFLYKTPNQAYQLLEDKVLLKLDWAKNQKTKSSLKKTVAFVDEGSSNSNTDKIMARMDAMTIKMDARYKEIQSRTKQSTPDLDDDGMPMSREEEAKFMQNFSKNHQASIQNLKTKFDRPTDKQSGRPFVSLLSNTQPNLRGGKAYQPPQARNMHVNTVFTRSGKSYDPPDNLDDQQMKTPINYDSDDEDDEPTPQPKTQPTKLVKETSLPKPYKPNISYPQRLRKEKIKAQYGKSLDMIRALRINIPLVDVLAEMPNYGKFLKQLIRNKHKIEQIPAAFLSDESSAIIQNKVSPKLEDPGSFLIQCNYNQTFSCKALADLGASINLMPYSLYAKLSLETLKPTKTSVRLANRSFQYPVGIAENMLVEVGKFTIPADFVILKMEEDIKVPLILGRPFLHTADAVIRVKQKQLNLGVETEQMIFNIDFAMKHSYSNDNTCFSIDVIDEILEEDFDALLAMTADENSESESDNEEPPFEKIIINNNYKIKTSLEEPLTDLELKPLPYNLEYVFLEEPFFLSVIISSKLSAQNKSKLVSIYKKPKEAFSWKTTGIPGICPSFYKHKIQLLDDKKPVVQKQRRLNPNMQEVVKKEIMILLDIGIIYLIADSPWVSLIHCVPKKGGITVVTKENDELVPARTVTGWRVCIDYCKLNEATGKDHFPLSFMDQMLERFAGNEYLCFLDGQKASKNFHPIYFASKTVNPAQQKYTLTEKELMAVVFAFDKFRSYLILSKTIVHTDHLPLKHLFKIQDAKPHFIRWILLLQEFDIEIKDRKGTENVAANYLSRIENDESSDDSEVDDNFPRGTLMEINSKDEPWFADLTNNLMPQVVSDVVVAYVVVKMEDSSGYILANIKFICVCSLTLAQDKLFNMLLCLLFGCGESQVKPKKEEEEKAAKVAAITETK
nr:reverse transcriptase domain-containing protein [Tanacetum cinerariifolium]